MKKTFKVRLQRSDGKEYLITYEGLSDALKNVRGYDEKVGWNQVTRSLREDVSALRDLMLSEILVPKARQEIINFLKDNPNIQTRNFRHKAWNYGDRSFAWYKAKEELEAEGAIVSQSHGKGKNRTWNIKEA